jgi:hypothetical protein
LPYRYIASQPHHAVYQQSLPSEARKDGLAHFDTIAVAFIFQQQQFFRYHHD